MQKQKLNSIHSIAGMDKAVKKTVNHVEIYEPIYKNGVLEKYKVKDWCDRVIRIEYCNTLKK